MMALLAWWLLIAALSLAALPLTLTLFRHLPDRGYPFARVVGILLPSFLAWFLGMLQLATYGPGLILLGVLLLAGLSGMLVWKDRTLLRWLREHRRLVLGYELLFAAALLCGALLRIYAPWGGPAIGHTEQPMDFAFLNGIMQSRALPPQDPWMAGATINYYYLGYFLAASLTLLSGLPSAVTFNLNLALILALAVCGCFSLGYNLTMAVSPRQPWRGTTVGALAAIFVLLVGNQVGALQMIAGSNQMAPLEAGETWTVLRARLGGETGAVPLGHRVQTGGDFGGGFDTIQPTPQRQIQDFDWWWPSRALWDDRPTAEGLEAIRASGQVGGAFFNWRNYVSTDQMERSYAITEFPFFSFYLGDMHPHVMSLPLTLCALALAVNIALSPERGRAALGDGRWPFLFLALHAVILGGLWMANSWDLPTYFLFFAAAWVWRWGREGQRWSRRDTLAVLRDLGILAGLCVLLYLPFHLSFRSLVGDKPIPAEVSQVPVLGWIVGLPGISKVFQTIALVFLDRTSLYTLLVIFGLFLIPLLTYLAVKTVQESRTIGWRNWIALGIVLLVAAVLALLTGFPLLLALPLGLLGLLLLPRSRPDEAVVLLMLLLALLLLLGCDTVYIRDIFESRMNTVFKFYYQVWVLLGVAAAWAVGDLFLLRSPEEAATPAGTGIPGRRLARLVALPLWILPTVVLLAGALIYPTLSLKQAFAPTSQETEVLGLRLNLPVLAEREWTLDGLSTMRRQYPGDYAGVQWLLQNAAPDAIVLEAVGPEWGYHGRVSAATGRPTLLGWDGHEAQWRGGQPILAAQIGVRRQAVQTIYETTDVGQARRLLEEYNVDYVFIGSLEAAYPAEGLAKFARLGTLAFEAPGVKIYRVSR